MPQFRKKPVEIEARQFTCEDDAETLIEWINEHAEYRLAFPIYRDNHGRIAAIVIPTLEGGHRANIGDWIIRGVQGQFYPCKPDIFSATYEPA